MVAIAAAVGTRGDIANAAAEAAHLARAALGVGAAAASAGGRAGVRLADVACAAHRPWSAARSARGRVHTDVAHATAARARRLVAHARRVHAAKATATRACRAALAGPNARAAIGLRGVTTDARFSRRGARAQRSRAACCAAAATAGARRRIALTVARDAALARGTFGDADTGSASATCSSARSTIFTAACAAEPVAARAEVAGAVVRCQAGRETQRRRVRAAARRQPERAASEGQPGERSHGHSDRKR